MSKASTRRRAREVNGSMSAIRRGSAGYAMQIDRTLIPERRITHPNIGSFRAIHVIAGLDVAFGGPTYSVPRLCQALARAGTEVTMLSVEKSGGSPSDMVREGYRDRRFAWDYAQMPIVRGARTSSGLIHALRDSAPGAAVIHNHGLWLMPNVYAGWEAVRARTPLVVAPRGMLSSVALTFSKLKKSVFWSLLQGPVIRGAACMHATSEAEYQEIRTFGLRNPVAIIPNGIDLPEPDEKSSTSGRPNRSVLSLGRIHPKKGLDRLVRAWAQVEPQYPHWNLRIIGPAEAGHDAELRTLATKLGLSRISIEGPIYDAEKREVYREADLFVLPTLNDNFAMTVAEALAAGIPAISTKGAPWSGLDTQGCGWWIEQGVEPLVAALQSAMAMPRQELNAMGAKGRAWMARDFSWDRVAGEVLAVYRWLSQGAAPPANVRFD
jgi:glycosyltransferase involved in cell wall biosynthesis